MAASHVRPSHACPAGVMLLSRYAILSHRQVWARFFVWQSVQQGDALSQPPGCVNLTLQLLLDGQELLQVCQPVALQCHRPETGS